MKYLGEQFQKFRTWFHRVNDLHEWEYSDTSKLPPCTRHCSVCKKNETMYSTLAGLFWGPDDLLEQIERSRNAKKV